MSNNSLHQNERIKSRKLIEELFGNPNTFKVFPFKIFYIVSSFPEENVPVKMTVSVPKRKFKRAVDRNQIKRWVREAYRVNKQSLYEKFRNNNLQLAVMFVYIGNELPNYSLVEEKIKQSIERFESIDFPNEEKN